LKTASRREASTGFGKRQCRLLIRTAASDDYSDEREIVAAVFHTKGPTNNIHLQAGPQAASPLDIACLGNESTSKPNITASASNCKPIESLAFSVATNISWRLTIADTWTRKLPQSDFTHPKWKFGEEFGTVWEAYPGNHSVSSASPGLGFGATPSHPPLHPPVF
jgi:hypothetical protein